MFITTKRHRKLLAKALKDAAEIARKERVLAVQQAEQALNGIHERQVSHLQASIEELRSRVNDQHIQNDTLLFKIEGLRAENAKLKAGRAKSNANLKGQKK